MALQQIRVPGYFQDLAGCFVPDLVSWAAPLPRGITSTIPGAGVEWCIKMLGPSLASLGPFLPFPAGRKSGFLCLFFGFLWGGFFWWFFFGWLGFFAVTTFPQAIDLEGKPSFPNYKTTHAAGTF